MGLTFPSGVTLDNATLAQWMRALQGCTSQEAPAFMREFRRRFGLQLVGDISGPSSGVAISDSYGVPAGNIHPLAERCEWLNLIRTGVAFGSAARQAAVAAQNLVCALQRPAADTARHVLVYDAWCFTDAAADVVLDIRADETGGAAVANLISGGGASNSLVLVTTQAAPAAVGQVIGRWFGAGQVGRLTSPQGFIAEAGAGFEVRMVVQTVNVAGICGFSFAEVASPAYP